jgi:hypothetical protein
LEQLLLEHSSKNKTFSTISLTGRHDHREALTPGLDPFRLPLTLLPE